MCANREASADSNSMVFWMASSSALTSIVSVCCRMTDRSRLIADRAVTSAPTRSPRQACQRGTHFLRKTYRVSWQNRSASASCTFQEAGKMVVWSADRSLSVRLSHW